MSILIKQTLPKINKGNNYSKMSEAETPLSSPPPDFAGLKVSLVAQAPNLPKRLRQCARFVLDNPDTVAFGTTAAVARAAGVQPSTLVRFAQVIGFSGFSDMQELFRDNLLARSQGGEGAPLRADDAVPEGTPERLARFAASAQAATATTMAELDVAAFEKAARLIAEADTVYLLGLRRSFPVVAYLFYAFGKIGRRVSLLDGVGGILADRTDLIMARDTLVVCTFHPYAPEVAEFAETVAQSGRTLVAITDSAFSPLEPMADVTLFVRDAQVGEFRSLSATMCLASALVAAVDAAGDWRA